MVTDTLLNSLKSLFSSLGAKTSDSNYAVGLYDKTSGEPKGLMGMSDFSSVMGGYNTKPVTLYANYVSAVETSRSTKASSGWGLFEGQNGYGNEIGWYGFVNSSGKAQCILFNAPSIGSITKGFYDGTSWSFYTLT